VKKSYSVTYGARNLRRLIQKEIEDAIAEKIVDQFKGQVRKIDISSDGESITVDAQ